MEHQRTDLEKRPLYPEVPEVNSRCGRSVTGQRRSVFRSWRLERGGCEHRFLLHHIGETSCSLEKKESEFELAYTIV